MNGSILTLEPINRPLGYQPVNLIHKNIEQPLVKLCGRGPSFVPTPTSIDWKGLQLDWIDFKKKVRWRTCFYTPDKALDGPEFAIDPLEPPYQKSVKEPPLANVPVIEVFLSRVEKDLFANSPADRGTKKHVYLPYRGAIFHFGFILFL